jgi:hypothetical protein
MMMIIIIIMMIFFIIIQFIKMQLTSTSAYYTASTKTHKTIARTIIAISNSQLFIYQRANLTARCELQN